ncbi:MAG: carboxypeptidase regulatory-like domain-containing protein [Planctomycetes bacterium]|nr:carboxypeptidase regulatory-like domain-containing protein [Planctomycetota bacterium]
MRTRQGTLLAGVALLALVVGATLWLLGDGRDEARQRLASPDAGAAGHAMDLAPTPARDAVVAPIEPPAIDAADAATPAIDLHVRLVAPDRSPVVGATVTLHSARERAWDDSPPLVTAHSDDDGRIVLTLDEVPPEGVGVVARADGFGSVASGGRGSVDWGHDEFEWTMPWAATVHGVVRDADDGAPLAHAVVSTSEGGPEVEADVQGRFALEGLLAEYDLAIVAREADHAPGSRSVRLAPGDNEVDLELRRGVRVDVEVVERDGGSPVPGAELRRSVRRPPFARADAAGRWAFRIATDELQTLVVTSDGFVPLRWSWDGHDATSDRTVRIPLQRSAWIDVSVTEVDGTPLPDAVAYAEFSGAPGFHDRVPLSPEWHAASGLPGHADDLELDFDGGCDAAGAAALPVIAGQEYRVASSCDGYVPGRSDPLVVPAPGAHARVTLVLPRAGSLVGRVFVNDEPAGTSRRLEARGPDGIPVGHAWLRADGSYSLERLPAGEVRLRVLEGPTGRTLGEDTVMVEAGVELEHDVRIEYVVAAIAGRVTFTDGTPAAGVHVRATTADAEPRWVGRTETDDDGRYTLEVEPDGVFDVLADSVANSEPRRATAGERDVDLVLPLLGTLRVRVVDAETGRPVVAGTGSGEPWAWWRDPSMPWALPLARPALDRDGEAELELPVGPVEFTVALDDAGYEPRTLSASVPQRWDGPPLLIALSRGHEVALRMVDAATGEPGLIMEHVVYLVPEADRQLVREAADGEANQNFGGGDGIRVRVDDPRLRGRWLLRGEDGLRRQRGLAPGRWALVIIPDDVRLEPDAIDVPAADGAPIEIRFTLPDEG